MLDVFKDRNMRSLWWCRSDTDISSNLTFTTLIL
jgi:hypothetical protein